MIPRCYSSFCSFSPSSNFFQPLPDHPSPIQVQRTLETLALTHSSSFSSDSAFASWSYLVASAMKELHTGFFRYNTLIALILIGRKVALSAVLHPNQIGLLAFALPPIFEILEQVNNRLISSSSHRFVGSDRFETVPNISNSLFFVNFLSNCFSVNFSHRLVLLWSMQLTLARNSDSSIEGPLFLRLSDVQGAISESRKVPLTDIVSFLLVKHLYNSLFEIPREVPIPPPISLKQALEVGASDEVVVRPFVTVAPLFFPRFRKELLIGQLYKWTVFQNGIFGLFGLSQYEPEDLPLPEIEDEQSALKFLCAYLAVSCRKLDEAALELFLTDPPEKLKESVQEYALKDHVLTTLLRSCAEGDIRAAQLLYSFGDSVLPFLNSGAVLHEILAYLIQNQRTDNLRHVTIFTAIELFRRKQGNGRIRTREFSHLLEDAHAILMKCIQGFAHHDLGVMNLILAGAVFPSKLDRFVPPTSILHFLFIPKQFPIRLATIIVYFGANLVRKPPNSEKFLDFVTNSYSRDAFQMGRPFPNEHIGNYLSRALESRTPATLAMLETPLPVILLPYFATFLLRNDDVHLFSMLARRNPRLVIAFLEHKRFLELYFQELPGRTRDTAVSELQNLLDLDVHEITEFVYHTISIVSVTDPDWSTFVFRHLLPRRGAISQILNEIPDFTTVSDGFIDFLKTVIDPLPKLLCPTIPSIIVTPSIEWNEDGRRKEESPSIWDHPPDSGRCSGSVESGSWFICLTCGPSERGALCFSCAAKCHRGHEIIPSSSGTGICGCLETICQFGDRRHKFPPQNPGLPTEEVLPWNELQSSDGDWTDWGPSVGPPPEPNLRTGDRGPDRNPWRSTGSRGRSSNSRSPADSRTPPLGRGIGPVRPIPYDQTLGFITTTNQQSSLGYGSVNRPSESGFIPSEPRSSTRPVVPDLGSRGRLRPSESRTRPPERRPQRSNPPDWGRYGSELHGIFGERMDRPTYWGLSRQPSLAEPGQRIESESYYDTLVRDRSPIELSQSFRTIESDTLSISTVSRLINRLINAQLLTTESEFINRLSEDITETSLSALPTLNDIQIVHFQRTQTKVFENTSEMIPGLANILSSIHGCLIAVVGPEQEFLLIADGSCLKTFRIGQNEVISRRTVSHGLIGLITAPWDSTVCAGWNGRQVYVFAIGSDGQIDLNTEVQLMLESLGTNLYVIGVNWVPYGPCHLAVTTSIFVKIYDVTEDCVSPLLCFTSQDKIISTIFVDLAQEPYLIAILNNGKIAVHSLENESIRGPIPLSHFVNFEFPTEGAILSYSPTTRIVFLSGRAGIFIFRPDQLLLPTVIKFTSITTRSSHREVFVAVHPTIPSLHFLMGANEGGILILEITNLGVVTNHIPSPLLGSEILPYVGAFCMGGSFSIVPIDGYIYTLRPGKPRGGSGLRYWPRIPIIGESMDIFTVPPSFWLSVILDKSGYNIIDSNGRPLSIKKLNFDNSPAHLFVQSRDPSRAIVAISIGIGRSSKIRSVKVLNRRQPIPSNNRKLFFPLKPIEVDIDLAIPIEIECFGRSVEITDFDVYFIPWKQSKKTLDWKTSADNLRAFSDTPETHFETDIEFIVASLSAAKFTVNNEIDRDEAINLLILMYRNSKLSLFCRRIILKSFEKIEDLSCLWTLAIKEVCQKGILAKEMRPLFWRDFALLPSNERDRISEIVWTEGEKESGIYRLIAGLLD